MIIFMILQAVYNIVDSTFVANMEGTGEIFETKHRNRHLCLKNIETF